MRWFPILLCIVLANCSIPMEDIGKSVPYVPPGAPGPTAQIEGVKKAISEEKIMGPVEISGVRASDRGWGRYMVCLKGQRDQRASSYYSVFFDNDTYKGVRESVTYDFCVQQSFRPVA
jgi:hypothetical protein